MDNQQLQLFKPTSELFTDADKHKKSGLNNSPKLITGDYDNERNTIIRQKLITPDLEPANVTSRSLLSHGR